MIKKAPLYQAYSLIKRERARRKMKMYKLAFGVMVDRTTAFYLVVLSGYVFVSAFMIGDFTNDYYEQFIMIEELAESKLWLTLTILPLRYLNQSFSKPGVMFSSSEYQLSLLPYSRGRIWLLSVFEKWLKLVLIYIATGCLIVFITPISSLLVLRYILLIMCFDVLMTAPQWKLYQKNFFIKLMWLCIMIVINFISVLLSVYLDVPIVGILLTGFLMMINVLLIARLFKGVSWNKVTEMSDFQLWNMWIISKASDVKITRQKKYSIFQKLGIGKKAFTYQGKKIYNRLWLQYFSKKTLLLLQLIGAIFIMLIVFLFLNGLIFSIGLVIAIYVYTTSLAIFFRDRFETDILSVLPWDLPSYKRSYFKYGIVGGIILLIPVLIFLGVHASIWMPFQFLFYCSSFLYIYHVKINKAIELLAKQPGKSDLNEAIGMLLLVSILFSWKYPMISLSFIIVVWLLLRRNKPVLKIE
jgi:hypothetical protein